MIYDSIRFRPQNRHRAIGPADRTPHYSIAALELGTSPQLQACTNPENENGKSHIRIHGPSRLVYKSRYYFMMMIDHSSFIINHVDMRRGRTLVGWSPGTLLHPRNGVPSEIPR